MRDALQPKGDCEAGSMAARMYWLTVDGELGDHIASAFPGMELTHGDGTTTLSGEMRDQAELQGAFQRISDLGLTLLATKSAKPESRSGRPPVAAAVPGRQRPDPQERSET
jgi:hypothetical protein